MKKIILIIACMGLAATGAFCQNVTTIKTATSSSSSAKYICPNCHTTYTQQGKCTASTCNNSTLIKEGDFYCPKCFTTSPNPGRCRNLNCRTPFLKMVAKS